MIARRLIRLLFVLTTLCCTSVLAQSTCEIAKDVGQHAELDGINGALRNNARQYLASSLNLEEGYVDRARLPLIYSQSKELVSSSLAAMGYFNAKVESRSHCRSTLQLAFEVELGPLTRVEQVTTSLIGEGQSDDNLTSIISEIEGLAFDAIDQERYEQIKQRLLDRSAQLGYFDAQFTRSELRINRDLNTAEIIWAFDTGARYLIGSIDVSQSVLDQDLMARYMFLLEGEPYDVGHISRLQNNLYASGFFSVVDVRSEPDRLSKTVPISIVLEPSKLNKVSLGLGYSTDERVRASLSWNRRIINRNGDKLRFDSKYSNDEASAIFTYSQLGEEPSTESNYYRLGFVHDDYREFYGSSETPIQLIIDSTRRFAQVGWVRYLGAWNMSYFAQIQRETLLVTDDLDDRIDTLLIYPAVNFKYLRADDLFRPTEGISADVNIRGGLESLGSDYDFLYISGQGTYTRAISPRQQITLRGWAGTNFFADIDELASNFRFYMGGDNTIRGYKYREIGPEEEGFLTGGESFLGASVEYEYFMFESLAGALFYDVGDAFNDTDIDLKDAVGIGLHWYSPIGPIKLEYAQPLDPNETPLLHLVIKSNL